MTVMREEILAFVSKAPGTVPGHEFGDSWQYFVDLLELVERERERLRATDRPDWPNGASELEVASYRVGLVILEEKIRRFLERGPHATPEEHDVLTGEVTASLQNLIADGLKLAQAEEGPPVH